MRQIMEKNVIHTKHFSKRDASFSALNSYVMKRKKEKRIIKGNNLKHCALPAFFFEFHWNGVRSGSLEDTQ